MLSARRRRQVRHRIIPGVRHLGRSRVRWCRCCNRVTLFASFSEGDEFNLCIRCRSGLRHEMLAEWIRHREPGLRAKTVVELDASSPLQRLLRTAGSYTRTYYSREDSLGYIRDDGARCEDLTRLTFPEESIDIMVSSEVLEHIPDLDAALDETHRVLRTGGYHLFTVPPREFSQCRAEIVHDTVHFLAEPEYHSDPLTDQGILAYWDIGWRDGDERFSRPGLKIQVVSEPEGRDRRIVWQALRTS